jgi:arylsulfatase
MYNLRLDPFERADITSNSYYEWYLDNAYLVLAAQALMVQFLQTFIEFPPRQKAASFTIDQALEKLEAALTSGH